MYLSNVPNVFVIHTSLHLLVVLGHVVWTNASQKLDVFITVKFGHLFLGGFVWPLYVLIIKKIN